MRRPRRYAEYTFGAPVDPTPSPPPAEAMLAAGRAVLRVDEQGLWWLRWREKPGRGRPILPEVAPSMLDAAYLVAMDTATMTTTVVSVRLDENLMPSNATAENTTGLRPELIEVAIGCPQREVLDRWGQSALGVLRWTELSADLYTEARDLRRR